MTRKNTTYTIQISEEQRLIIAGAMAGDWAEGSEGQLLAELFDDVDGELKPDVPGKDIVNGFCD